MIWLLWVASFIAMNAHANSIVCPSVINIENVGLSENVVQSADGKWYTGRMAQSYGTQQLWTFVIGGITAPDKQKAITFANLALSTLSYKSGPTIHPSGQYLCVYNNDFGYLSGAITPPINDFKEIKID